MSRERRQKHPSRTLLPHQLHHGQILKILLGLNVNVFVLITIVLPCSELISITIQSLHLLGPLGICSLDDSALSALLELVELTKDHPHVTCCAKPHQKHEECFASQVFAELCTETIFHKSS